jgi:hypothetical protein
MITHMLLLHGGRRLRRCGGYHNDHKASNQDRNYRSDHWQVSVTAIVCRSGYRLAAAPSSLAARSMRLLS